MDDHHGLVPLEDSGGSGNVGDTIAVTDFSSGDGDSTGASGADGGEASRVTKTSLVAYFLGEFGLFVAASVQGFFALEFFLEVAAISPYEAGVILLCSQIFDGVSDPIVGMLSDRTKCAFRPLRGRRRIWMVLGSIPFAVFWWLIWQVPPDGWFTEDTRWFYYLFCTLGLAGGYTSIGIPYAAATPELAQTYNDRTALTSSRFAGGLLGGLLATFAFAQLQVFYVEPDVRPLDVEADHRRGYSVAATVTTPVVFLGPLLCGLLIRERTFERALNEGKVGLEQATTVKGMLRGYLGLLKNRAYVLLLATYCLAWLVINFVQSNFLLFIKFVLQLESQAPYMVVILQGTAAVLLVPTYFLSAKIGKKATYICGMSTIALALIVVFFIPPGGVVATYICLVFASFGLATAMLVPWSMLPDVIDLDEVQHGHRREGELVALLMIFQKVGLGMALSVSSFVLGAAGYESPEEQEQNGELTNDQPENVIWTLRVLVTLFPAGLTLVSFATIAFYPLNKRRVAEIQATLKMRKEGTASEPLISDGATAPLLSGTHETKTKSYT